MELLKIRTEQFEGPMDLLLFLIQKNELDISEFAIHKITDQYVQYIEMMRELNFDMASEFLVMAATLIHLKSKRLLPGEDFGLSVGSDDDLPTSEEELVRRLREYKKFQQAAHSFADMPMLGRDFFARPGVEPPEKQTVWKEMDLTSLTICFQDVLRRSRKRSKIIIRESTSIPERINELLRVLKVDEMTEFENVLSATPDRTEVIMTFIALLELARLKKLKVYQNTTFGTIYLTLTEAVGDIDPTLITGFQYTAKIAEELASHG